MQRRCRARGLSRGSTPPAPGSVRFKPIPNHVHACPVVDLVTRYEFLQAVTAGCLSSIVQLSILQNRASKIKLKLHLNSELPIIVIVESLFAVHVPVLQTLNHHYFPHISAMLYSPVHDMKLSSALDNPWYMQERGMKHIKQNMHFTP